MAAGCWLVAAEAVVGPVGLVLWCVEVQSGQMRSCERRARSFCRLHAQRGGRVIICNSENLLVRHA